MNIPDKVTGDSYTASEFDQFKNEVQNAITSSAQSLTGNSIQLQQAFARYAANGSSGTDSGIADAYVWNSIGNNDPVTALLDGQEFSLVIGNSNTGASTLQITGLATKSITKNGFTQALASDDLESGRPYTFRYSLSDDVFTVATGLGSSSTSAAGNGYWTADNGIIVQWGSVAITATIPVTVSLPITFPNAAFVATATRRSAASVASVESSCSADLMMTQITIAPATGNTGTKTFEFIAIGN